MTYLSFLKFWDALFLLTKTSWFFHSFFQVVNSQVEALSKWKPSYSIGHVLTDLHKSMSSGENRKRSQPPEGIFYY